MDELLLRRRALINADHDFSVPGWDGCFWAYYDVNDTTNATQLLGATTGLTGPMIVDGEEQTLATTYTFSTTGTHLVKFRYSSTLNKTFSNANIKRLTELYFPLNSVAINSTNTNSPIYNLNGTVSIKANGVVNDMICLAYGTSTANATIDIELNNLTNWTLARSNNVTRKLVAKGTYSSIPAAAVTGFNGTNNYRYIWIESPNLTTIANSNFTNMQQIQTIVVNVATPPTMTGSTYWTNTNNTFKLYVPYSDDHSILNAYKSATGWSTKANQIYELNSDGTIPV